MPDCETAMTNQEPNQTLPQEIQLQTLRQLFAETQALPQLQNLTDEEIMAEIAAVAG
jgi:hypothetical protein